jgi:GNAT superfamily N-acetyltransferase
MTEAASLETLRAYWRQHIGFDPDMTQGIVVARPEGTMGHYHGVYVFRRGYGCIVSPPQKWRALLRDALAGCTPDEAFDVATLQRILGADAAMTIGPSWIGLADETDAARVTAQGARLLEERDRAALLALKQAVTPTEWEHSAIELDRTPVFGVFEGPALLAAASYEPWGERISAVGILTHPLHRRRGCATVVAAAAVAHGLARKQLMLWQTLESNIPSITVAHRLGFQPYARTIAIRLRAEANHR